MRSILLHVHNDDGLDARVRVALDLIRTFDGHLTCLQAIPYDLGLPGDFYGLMAVELLPVLRKAAAETRERLERSLAARDVAWDWIEADGLAAEELLRRSGLSDLIVLGSRDEVRNGPAPLAGDIVLHSHMPVLIVPPETRQLDCSGPAIVAWNGSLEASRALRGALPLLARASSVELLTVRGGKESGDGELPPTEGAEYLSRHGITCGLTELLVGDATTGQTLMAGATARGASYLVMGAYGHPRMFEAVWGGVTHELLRKPPLPIFTCH
jgi:nucleotide-binding universal stress UspA family protein